ncbi:hypothetical protein GCM10022222_59850 [Amycolatopsis ultiminotia]|uniref:Uncharacterized protein n=1 Tax=Amycolatopsis ultiminotia TaxID=543629 RepID=A0ABP6XJR1_9PSEU
MLAHTYLAVTTPSTPQHPATASFHPPSPKSAVSWHTRPTSPTAPTPGPGHDGAINTAPKPATTTSTAKPNQQRPQY